MICGSWGSISFGVVGNLSEIGLKVNFSKHLRGPFEKSDTVNFEMLEDYLRLQGKGKIAWISPND